MDQFLLDHLNTFSPQSADAVLSHIHTKSECFLPFQLERARSQRHTGFEKRGKTMKTSGLRASDLVCVLNASQVRNVSTLQRRPGVHAIKSRALEAVSSLLLLGLAFHTGPLHATLMSDFDGVNDTPVTLEAFADGGPSIEASGGNPDEFLRLTEDGVNNQLNFASFDLTDAGTHSTSSFSFDFRIDAQFTGSADGFSFSYADTSTYGTTGGLGSSPFVPEDPAASGVLGFGFDTWSNQGLYDDPNQFTGSDYNDITVFWDGALVYRIDDTRLLTPALTLDDGLWHSVSGFVNFDLATVSLSVDGNALFTDLAVPGLAPFESRVLLAGRTGGENQLTAIDNVLVEYDGTVQVPEPATLWLLLLGAAGVLLLQSRRRLYQRLPM